MPPPKHSSLYRYYDTPFMRAQDAAGRKAERIQGWLNVILALVAIVVWFAGVWTLVSNNPPQQKDEPTHEQQLRR